MYFPGSGNANMIYENYTQRVYIHIYILEVYIYMLNIHENSLTISQTELKGKLEDIHIFGGFKTMASYRWSIILIHVLSGP